ncbi:MAG: AAA family ATPase [Pseudomonadota bacterium]
MIELPGYSAAQEIHRNKAIVVVRALRLADRLPVVIKYSCDEYPAFKLSARLRNEFDILHHIQSPRVARALGFERVHNRMLLVLEDGGEPLARLCAAPLPLADFLDIAAAAAEGLAAIHARNVIHKNISPDNILFERASGAVKIIDFGVASYLLPEHGAARHADTLDGTLGYISPEQTGRTKRAPDFRSDLYSLGATFYHLLAGVAPFAAADAMELVHAHLAREARPLAELRPGIPEVLAAIVAKLMAKSVERRYQSAQGLLHDLQECRRRLGADGAPFALATRDVAARFELPRQMVGRAREGRMLAQAFERAAAGGAELLLVGGYSGVGKSALVGELHKPVVRRGGYFAAGKCDQFERSVPYFALTQAFSALVHTILTEAPARLERWRANIAAALGPNGRVVAEVIPALEQLIGPQPAVPALAPADAQSRFNRVFQDFVSGFAQAEHPLVLFLDDLQWIDYPSLVLLEGLLERSDLTHLLLVAAYRDNEVGEAHPFMQAVERIRTSQRPVHALALQALTRDDVGALVAETVRRTPEQALPLTELLYQKTGGNPFFLIQLMHSLYESKLLTVDHDSNAWRWDIGELGATAITDNIVELMTQRIGRLPPACEGLLKVASCIGSTFELALLATLSGVPTAQAAGVIWPALAEGLIVPVADTYAPARAPAAAGGADAVRDELDALLRRKIDAGQSNPRYRFSHDRVRQASYESIAPAQRKAEHLRIGRLLLAREAGQEHPDAAVFEVAKHFNLALELLDGEAERLAVAQLNLRAGRRAKSAAATRAVVEHMSVALELVGADAWERHYALAFELYQSLAESHYLLGNFKHSDALSMEAVSRARNAQDCVAGHATRIQLFMTGAEFPKALETARTILALRGFVVPHGEADKAAACARELARINARLEGRELAALIDLPVLSDPDKKVTLDLLVPVWAAVYFAGDRELSKLVVYWMVSISLEHGNADASAMGYVLHGMQLAGAGDYPRAHAFGKLGLALNAGPLPNPVYTPKVNNMFANSINPYLNHLATGLPYYEQSYVVGAQVGDIFWGLWAVQFRFMARSMKGDNLAEVVKDADAYAKFVHDTRDGNIINAFALHRQILLCLQGRTGEPGGLDSDTFSEAAHVRYFEERQFHGGLLWFRAFKLGLQVHMRQFDGALATAAALERIIPLDYGQWAATNHYFYQSLAILACDPAPNPARHAAREALLERNEAKFALWSAHCAPNFLHRHQLMCAERARRAGRAAEAAPLYDLSIGNAAAGGFTNDEALALECAAHFYLGQGRQRIAQVYLTDAYYAYERWGAHAKTAQLEAEYGKLLLHRRAAPAAAPAAAGGAADGLTHNGLDLATLMKAARTISGEIVHEKLLLTLMSILMENAGAERGLLILERNDAPVVEIDADMRASSLIGIALAQFPDLVHGVVNYVRRTRETLVLDEAGTDPRFAGDTYVERARPKSVLCLPIMHHGRLYGLAYFENKHSAGVFTRDRLAVLELLISQAGISIDNASLYHELEQRVQERTGAVEAAMGELQATQRQMLFQEKMASIGTLTAGIAHEINNPANFAHAGAQTLKSSLEQFRAFLLKLAGDDADTEVLARLNRQIDGLTGQVDIITEGTLRIRDLVRDLRTFTRLGEAEKKSVRIADSLDSTINLVRMQYAEHVRFECALTANPELRCWPALLNQVFMNLVVNACQAIEAKQAASGWGEPGVLSIRNRIEGDRLIFEFEDSGAGIPAHELGRVFDPFFTTKDVGAGTGLGLSISFGIIEKHEGTISVRSTLGSGTCFTISLPLAGPLE